MRKDDIFGGVILCIVIAAIGLFLYFAKSAPELSYGPVELSGSVLQATPNSTTEVTISGTLVESGFVTIHQAMGTAPGEIVGTSGLIAAGAFSSVVIHLTKPMEYAGPYIALLHVDNGDGVFVVNDDMPVTSNGASVRADFDSPPETK